MVGQDRFDEIESRLILCGFSDPESRLEAVELAVMGLDCLEFRLTTSELLLKNMISFSFNKNVLTINRGFTRVGYALRSLPAIAFSDSQQTQLPLKAMEAALAANR